MGRIGNVSLNHLLERILNLEKEGKIVSRMFNCTDSLYVAKSDIHRTMLSTLDSQIQSTVLKPLNSYEETDSYESNELKDLQTEMAALRSFVLEQFSIINKM